MKLRCGKRKAGKIQTKVANGRKFFMQVMGGQVRVTFSGCFNGRCYGKTMVLGWFTDFAEANREVGEFTARSGDRTTSYRNTKNFHKGT